MGHNPKIGGRPAIIHKMAGVLRLVLIVAGLFSLGAGDAVAQARTGRVALVAGNANYKDASPLVSPLHDAEEVAAALIKIGFDVVMLKDARGDDLREALTAFSERSAKADMSIVYFAGHSIEYGGENHFVPVDANITSEASIWKEAVPLRVATLSVARARSLGLVILDACRKHGFLDKIERRNERPEFDGSAAPTEAIRNVLMFFAAESGKTVEDGDARNSPLATALVKYLGEPGLEISFLFRNVRDDVRKSTRNKQTPYMYGQLSRGKIFLNGAPDAKSSSAAVIARPSDAANLQVHPCDVHATSPADPERVRLVKGTRTEDIKASEARDACLEATARFPGVSRFHFQLGRAAFAGKDYETAVASYRKAGELGSGLALHALGAMYEEGTGVEKDASRARFYYEFAAENNAAPAMVSLAMQYERGAGVPVDHAKAYQYYKRAADLGNARAINHLGQFSEKGVVVSQNANEARALYEKSAAMGDDAAMVNLARLHVMGLGVRRDYGKARHWLNLAKQAGSVDAPRLLQQLDKPKRR